MSARTRQAIVQLSKSVNENSARINQILLKNGVNPDPAFVFTAAKYFEALSKLAEE